MEKALSGRGITRTLVSQERTSFQSTRAARGSQALPSNRFEDSSDILYAHQDMIMYKCSLVYSLTTRAQAWLLQMSLQEKQGGAKLLPILSPQGGHRGESRAANFWQPLLFTTLKKQKGWSCCQESSTSRKKKSKEGIDIPASIVLNTWCWKKRFVYPESGT